VVVVKRKKKIEKKKCHDYASEREEIASTISIRNPQIPTDNFYKNSFTAGIGWKQRVFHGTFRISFR
jgi:hypothetical protein